MSMPDVATFCADFFALFGGAAFRGKSFIEYIQLPAVRRTGDEAAVVDMAISGPLLGLLGFAPGQRGYNQQRLGERPDFVPNDPICGSCFVVEDKSTSLDLTLDLHDPTSHLAQLQRYVRANALRYGILTNGRRLLLYRFDGAAALIEIDVDIVAALRVWAGDAPALREAYTGQLRILLERCHRDAFTQTERLEAELTLDETAWAAQALPLGTTRDHDALFVSEIQTLLGELQRDAFTQLTYHLERNATYLTQEQIIPNGSASDAATKLGGQRGKLLGSIAAVRGTVGLSGEDVAAIEALLIDVTNPQQRQLYIDDLVRQLLGIVNAARERKAAPRPSKPWSSFAELAGVEKDLQEYCDIVLRWRRHQAELRHTYRADRAVAEDFDNWRALVQQTTLGAMDAQQQQQEFALQAAYVVFIRLLLIRICEDKQIFPQRFLSDGGIKHWKEEDIARYMRFADGNPYEPLLDMAYRNAQNIYAHFFTGRELFNWYRLDRARLMQTLSRLSRFNFAQIDADLIGTIYNSYVARKEKREKGQYYTPPEVVSYILDEVGYVTGSAIVGEHRRLIDPACGSGSFLVAAARRLVQSYTRGGGQLADPVAVIQRVRDTFYGFDLNPFACYLAEVNLLIQMLDLVRLVLDRGTRPSIGRFHIYNDDALVRPTDVYAYARYSTQIADESDEVAQIKLRPPGTPYERGFAFVVANPPYGATLSDEYKTMLRREWPEVFQGKPDTYVFFFGLALRLLSAGGKLGFITPNTYLMGTNAVQLRRALLTSGTIEQIVDLPQGIWPDANVDCALLFLTSTDDAARRERHIVTVHTLGLSDTLDRLAARNWRETIEQPQRRWSEHPAGEINIRYDDLLKRIEAACLVNGKVLRLGDITESSQGIIPYHTKADSANNPHIMLESARTNAQLSWKPLLDGNSFIGRYDLRWGSERNIPNYGLHLYTANDPKFYERPKLLVQDMRNRALKRRLVATYDDQKFYNRHNFSNIIARSPDYDLKYVLALFNSSLLNYWFARQFDNLHINPSYFRQLPIAPASADEQAPLIALVDALLVANARLNTLREQGYTIRTRRDGVLLIEVPYDELLDQLRADGMETLDLFDAESLGLIQLAGSASRTTAIGDRVYVPERHPESVVLKHQQLWLTVTDTQRRRFLAGYLALPQWRGKTWNDIARIARVPADTAGLTRFFSAADAALTHVTQIVAEIERLDLALDAAVFERYGISAPADRRRVLGSVAGEATDGPEGEDAAD